MCIKTLPTNQIQRCEAWKAEARRVEGSCFMCRSKRKVCSMEVVVPVDRRALEASDRRVDQHFNDLLSSAPGKARKAEEAKQARRDLQDQQRKQQQQKQKQKQKLPVAPPKRPARPPPALQPGVHVATQQQQQVRSTNGYSSSSNNNNNNGRPVGQQRIAIPMSKYSTLANARPSPMPRVPPPPPPPTAPTRHRPTRERRATQHPAAVARSVSPVEGCHLSTFTPSPVSPVAQVKVRYGKSYFDMD
ncbi:uncharacterized protein PgNI_04911 [Pyricularia grisea]|uniref:Uncharacterized protein n=1 Tax=Pyricularia grisea TaxID=148305 RepID=A0A6P8B8K8_PYRGI|nr:uncharacterized protein PgNI_04911 [Pyricularia grisea]TLD12175.1 hypothetical protein PgNI_04911 [Pyricularia grisea]